MSASPFSLYIYRTLSPNFFTTFSVLFLLFKKEFSEGKLQWDAEVRLGNNQRKYIKSYKITFRKLAVRDPNVDESKILSNIYEKAILLNKLEQNGFLIFIEDLKDIDKQLKRLGVPDKVLPLGTRYHFDFKYGEILRKSIWHTIFISSELIIPSSLQ